MPVICQDYRQTQLHHQLRPGAIVAAAGRDSLESLLLGRYQACCTFNVSNLPHDHLDHQSHDLCRIPETLVDDSQRQQYPLESISVTSQLRSSTKHSLCVNNNTPPGPEIASAQLPHSFPCTTFLHPDHHHDDRINASTVIPHPLLDLNHDSPSWALPSNAHQLKMTTIVSSIPGSPPDLSGSRSSKSSSLSSTFSTPEGLESDNTHFEEIGLQDDQNVSSQAYHSRDLSMQSVASHHELMRSKDNLTFDKKPTLSHIHTRVSSGGPKPTWGQHPLKRGLTAPEGLFASNSMRTRSSSPPTRRPLGSGSMSSHNLGGLRPIPQAPASLGVPSRRSSWQPQRKTIKELEDEYHDSDDELPDDASLWNVPISPSVTTGQRSHRSSFRGSPDREGLSQSPGPIPLAHAKTAPDSPPRQPMHSQILPRHRPQGSRTVSLNPSLSNPSSPRSRRNLRSTRTKSWNIVMSDLSEEARVISQALEYHAETEKREKSHDPTWNTSREELSTSASLKVQKSVIQLPEIQKSTLDFMPISREKEAILSRTRPSWLPPKNPKEERKHLREYQKMMAASLEAEKKRQSKVQAQKTDREITNESLQRIWTFYIDETTDLSIIDKRIYDLCWRGITPSLRGKVWQRTIGNSLGLTVQSYEKALGRAREIKNRPQAQLDRHAQSMGQWFVDIERDAETAFPELNLFQRHGPMWQDLVDVCEAYTCYRSDVGYMYGMQLMAALMLLQLPTPADAFILMANCLNRSAPLAFQTSDGSATSRIYHHAISTLSIKFPRLHEYLFGSVEQGGLGFSPGEILEPMFRTIFSNGLDVDRLCRIWDIWVFEGDRALVRAAVAILGCLQSQLFDIRGDIDLKRRNTQEMLGWGPFNRQPKSGHWNLHTIGDEEKFMEEVRLAGTLDVNGR